MYGKTTVLVLGFALSLAACAPAPVATRAEGGALALPTTGTAQTPVAAAYDVQRVDVVVPRSLKVSEANAYYPVADIVWRGEPIGDRHAQVEAMWREASDRATAPMSSGTPVVVTVEVTRFHCLTEKTRYSFGGVHSLHFLLTVTNASTGEVIDGPRRVVADVKASGGNKAIQEEAQGITQRVVIVDRLAQVLASELARSAPAGGGVAQLSSRGASDFVLGIAPITE